MNTLTDLLLGVGQPRVSHFPDLCTLLYTYLSTLDYWTKIVYYLFTQTSPVAHTSALTPTYIKSQKLPNWPISKELGLGRMLLPHWKLLLLLLSRSFAQDINDCIPQIFFMLTLVHLMAWCHQATCYYQHQYWWKSPMPYGNTIQWETMLHCNIDSHWLGAYTKWSLKHNEKYSVLILRSSSAVELTVGLPVMP